MILTNIDILQCFSTPYPALIAIFVIFLVFIIKYIIRLKSPIEHEELDNENNTELNPVNIDKNSDN